jgi:hypothetical protein
MNDSTHDGGCHCGAIRYRVTGALRHVSYCHCESCRRTTGAPFVAWGTCALNRFSVLRGKLSQYASSEPVIRGFCGSCGTSLTYSHRERPQEIDVILVTLDDPDVFTPGFHVWVRDKLPWVNIEDGLPQFETASTGNP